MADRKNKIGVRPERSETLNGKDRYHYEKYDTEPHGTGLRRYVYRPDGGRGPGDHFDHG